jgi:hypothetical protein
MPPKLKSPLKRTRCAGQGSLQHFANNVCVLLVEIWRCPWQLSSESFDSGAPITGSHCNRSASFCDLVFSNQGPPNNLSNPSSPNLTLRAPPSSTPPISGRQARYPGMIAVTAPRHNCQCVRYAYVVGSTYSSHFPETSGAYRTTIHRLRGLRYDQSLRHRVRSCSNKPRLFHVSRGTRYSIERPSLLLSWRRRLRNRHADGNAYVSREAGPLNFPVSSSALQPANTTRKIRPITASSQN